MNRPPASDRVLERARRMMKSEILVGRPDPEGLRALAGIIFPGEDVDDPRFLPWLYDRNPRGRAIEFMTRDRETVSGHIAIVPLRYKIGSGEMTGGIAINAITHPDYRGRGIFIVLHDLAFKKAAEEDIPFTFGFANPNSEKGCLRHLAYRELARLPLWILPLNLPRILASVPSKQGAAWRLAAGAAQPFARLWRSVRRPRRTGRIEVGRLLEFGPDADALWPRASTAVGNILVRDRAFLNWRFVASPTRGYDLFAARVRGRLAAYLAGRLTEVEGLRWGMIVDLLAEDTDEGLAAAAALTAAYTHQALGRGADIAAGLMLAPAKATRALRRNGYLVCPPALLPREFPALLHWNLPGEPPPGLFDPRTWFLTLADYDAV